MIGLVTLNTLYQSRETQLPYWILKFLMIFIHVPGDYKLITKFIFDSCQRGWQAWHMFSEVYICPTDFNNQSGILLLSYHLVVTGGIAIQCC